MVISKNLLLGLRGCQKAYMPCINPDQYQQELLLTALILIYRIHVFKSDRQKANADSSALDNIEIDSIIQLWAIGNRNTARLGFVLIRWHEMLHPQYQHKYWWSPYWFQHSSANSKTFSLVRYMSKTGQTLPNIIVAPACNPEELRVQSRNTLLEASVHSNTENLGHIIFSMTVCIIAVQNILFLLKTFLFSIKTNKQTTQHNCFLFN